MRLIIISGRAGSGKTTALNQLEDEGFYCVDNLPTPLLSNLVEASRGNPAVIEHGLAVCIDTHTSTELDKVQQLLDVLPEDVSTEILYFDAGHDVLVRRFSETRRRHPLSDQAGSLDEAIAQEQTALAPIAADADLTIDSSKLTAHQLRRTISERVVGAGGGQLSVQLMSFGFKHGVPGDADLVFDLRMLPNPHWQRELRNLTGRDQPVVDFLQDQDPVNALSQELFDFLGRWLPAYRDSGRRYLCVALGCTGGQHRSVYLAERLHRELSEVHQPLSLRHREL